MLFWIDWKQTGASALEPGSAPGKRGGQKLPPDWSERHVWAGPPKQLTACGGAVDGRHRPFRELTNSQRTLKQRCILYPLPFTFTLYPLAFTLLCERFTYQVP